MEWLPTPSLTKHVGNTKYSAIKEIHQLLMSNEVSVGINLNVGQKGYLGIILPPEQYDCISDTAFFHPPDPGRTATSPALASPRY